MATPERSKMKGGLSKSLPSQPTQTGTAPGVKTDNDLSDDSSSGRRHTSSSVPRTKFTSQTPSNERDAINQLKTKMTFSDRSTGSSGKSTPTKKHSNLSLDGARGAATDPPSKRATSQVPSSPPGYVVDAGRDDLLSEGEVTAPVSIPDILAKLDSVKNYLREAEALHKQLQGKLTQPGASTQVEKLEKLIQDLRQQESAYLSILLRIMDHSETGSQLNTTQEESGSEYSEDEDSLEEVSTDRTLQEQRDNSLSLRAQLDKSQELTPDQEEELQVLRQQQQMLQDLIEQQEKIKELEEKQAELLRRRSEAQRQLAEAEARTEKYRRQAEAAAIEDEPPPDETKDQLSSEEVKRRGELMQRLSALKERKEMLEGLMDSFTQLQVGGGEAGDGSEDEEGSEDGDGSEGGEGVESSHGVDQEQGVGSASEFVSAAEVRSDSRMTELEDKLKQAAEAKQKLEELRQMIDGLKEATGGAPPSLSEPLQWRHTLKEREATGDEGEGEEDTTLEGQEELDQSLVADYQQRLAGKRREVAELQRQKEELLLMQEKILAMQKNYLDPTDSGPAQAYADPGESEEGEDEVSLPPHLAQELKKQQQLYNEIMAKTRRLKDLRAQYQEELAKTSEHDTYSLTSSTRLLTDADLTAATWGGSTVQSEESEGEESASSLSVPVAAVIAHGGSHQAMGGSATVQQPDPREKLAFSVTRHTPRRHPARRTLSDTGDTPRNVGKKRKLDSQSDKATNPPVAKKGATPTAPSQLSAVWPGVIFPPQRSTAVTKDTATQTPTHHPAGSPSVTFTPPTADPQFSLMFTDLLHSQNSLVRALCQRMEMETSMNQLVAYHRDLEVYYHDLCRAHAQLGQPVTQADTEEPVNDPSQANPTAKAQVDQPGYPCVDPSPGTESRHSSFIQPPPPPPTGLSQSPYPPRPPYQPGWYTSPAMASFPFSPYQHRGGASSFQGWPHLSASGCSPQNFFSLSGGNQQSGLNIPRFRPGGRESTLESPSGVTSTSVQVQAPSTPPPSTPPSVNTQQSSHSLNNNNNNMTSVLVGPSSPGVRFPLFTASPSQLTDRAKGESRMAASHSMPSLEPASGGFKFYTASTSQQSPAQAKGDRGQTAGRETQREEDEESFSSMPVSVPDDADMPRTSSEQLLVGSGSASGFSVFDALRDTIYSEVATLIANNEARPHFLVELFRELQQLNSDYLRQRALYNIQDLVTRFLTGDEEATLTHRAGQDGVESAASESEVTTEEEPSRPPLPNSSSQAFDYVELVQSASSVSTPPCPDQPFASEDLGETVIRLDKALSQAKRESERAGSLSLQPVVVSPSPLTEDKPEPEAAGVGELDTQVLDEQIKDIMTEVIPVLKANMASQCTPDLLELIKKIVLDLVLKQEKKRNPEFLEMLTKQLDATITDTLGKYAEKKFSDCGEDMLVDLSEVLFNELSFFSLMQDLRDHPQLSSDFQSVTSSQTTTENEEDGEEQRRSMDPLLLQALTLQASRTLVDEEEALGKIRDDELAKTWNPRDSVQSDEESDTTKEGPKENSSTPTPSVEVSGDSSQVPSKDHQESEPANEVHASDPPVSVPSQNGVSDLSALTPSQGSESVNGVADPPPHKLEPVNGVSDPSAPLPNQESESVNEVSDSSTPVHSSEPGEIESVGGIKSEDGASQNHVSSPPSVSLESTPKLDLEVQMRNEQKAIEGIPGIIASIETQEQGLAGNADELPPSSFTEP